MPRERNPTEEPVDGPRDEHPGPLHVLAVLLAELRGHPALLVSGEEVVNSNHDSPQRHSEEARPEDCESDAGHGQRQVLRVANPAIQATQRRAAVGEFVEVDLAGAHEEHERSAHEQE